MWTKVVHVKILDSNNWSFLCSKMEISGYLVDKSKAFFTIPTGKSSLDTTTPQNNLLKTENKMLIFDSDIRKYTN